MKQNKQQKKKQVIGSLVVVDEVAIVYEDGGIDGKTLPYIDKELEAAHLTRAQLFQKIKELKRRRAFYKAEAKVHDFKYVPPRSNKPKKGKK